MGAMRAAGCAVYDQFMRKSVILISVITSSLICPAEALADFNYVTHWTRFDTSGANALFNGPADVAFLKSNGDMLIVDSNAGVCNGNPCTNVGAAPPTTEGEVVMQQVNGTYVGLVTPNNNSGPVRAAVDPNSGDVFLGTYYEATIRRYTDTGGTLTLTNTWTGCTANGGNGPYAWGKTFGVATDSTGAIYVSDYDNRRILKMNTSGQCLAAPLTTYTKNSIPGQVFLNLTGLAVDSSDNLWAADYGKKVLVKYNSAGAWQTTLTGFSNCGTTTAFSTPRDIAIDLTTNDMFVTEGSGANSGVIKLDSSGNFLTKATKYNTSTTFSSPFGGGFTSGFYYATDYGHSAVVKYQNPTRKVSVTASANGTVAADVGGIITGTTGGNTCVDQFVDATTVVLTATPASGYGVAWSGADGTGCTGNTCTLNSIAASKVVTATFALTNATPVASNVAITGTAQVGVQLTGSYTYTDADLDLQGTSTFRWVRNTVNTGVGGGSNLAVTQNYTLVGGDQGNYLYFCVSPVAQTGNTTGTEVCSGATAQIPTQVNGACVVSSVAVTTAPTGVAACTTGSVSSAASSASQFTWDCVGSGGGTSTAGAACSVPRGYNVTPSAGSNGSITPNAVQVIGYNSPTTFTVTPNAGYASNVAGTCGGNLSGTSYATNAIITACTVDATFTPTSSQANIPTHQSGVSATLSVIGCTAVGSAVFVDAPAAGKPTSKTFPYGLLDFTLTGCVGSADVTVTYSQPISAGATYYKEVGGTYSAMAATIGGNSVHFTLTDNGTGDADNTVGTIRDPSGLAFGLAADVSSIPTLSEWGLITLSALMAIFGIRQTRRRTHMAVGR